jgi:hypothetical protein
VRSTGALVVLVSGCGFSGAAGAGADTAEVAAAVEDRVDAAVAFDAAVDAAAADAPQAFDPSLCPDGFSALTGTTSRYRVEGAIVQAWSQAVDTCDALVGTGYRAHLVVFENLDERASVWSGLGPSVGYNWFWTGAYLDTPGDWKTILGTNHVPDFADGQIPSDVPSPERAIAVGQTPTGTRPGDLSLFRPWSLRVVCECDGLTGTRP